MSWPGSPPQGFIASQTARPIFNVTTYGADPLGLVDSTTAIQNAIDGANTAGGGMVFFPTGTFLVSSGPLIVHGKVHMTGEGMFSSILKSGPSYNNHLIKWQPTVTEYFFMISQMEILGRIGGTIGHGVFTSNASGGTPSDFYMDHVFVTQCQQNGVDVLAAFGMKITDCVIETNNGVGLSINGGDQNYITNNFIAYNKGTYGMLLNGNTTHVIGNTIFQNNQHGLVLSGAKTNNQIIGNVIKGNAQVSTGDGLWLDNQSYTNVIGNLIDGESKQRYGIALSAGGPSNVVIKGNTLLANLTAPIQPNFGQTILIDGNLGYNPGLAGQFGATLQKSESALDNNVLTYTPSAIAGTYRVHFAINVSAATAATLGWTMTWKDSNGTAQSPTNLDLIKNGVAAPALTFLAAAGDTYAGDTIVDIDNSATAIVCKLTFTGTSFTAKVSAFIEQMA